MIAKVQYFVGSLCIYNSIVVHCNNCKKNSAQLASLFDLASNLLVQYLNKRHDNLKGVCIVLWCVLGRGWLRATVGVLLLQS